MHQVVPVQSGHLFSQLTTAILLMSGCRKKVHGYSQAGCQAPHCTTQQKVDYDNQLAKHNTILYWLAKRSTTTDRCLERTTIDRCLERSVCSIKGE